MWQLLSMSSGCLICVLGLGLVEQIAISQNRDVAVRQCDFAYVYPQKLAKVIFICPTAGFHRFSMRGLGWCS